jgi:predicted transglutaminase-like cysteine proteinase
MYLHLFIVAFAVIAAATFGPARASHYDPSMYWTMVVEDATSVPIGAYEFCRRAPGECRGPSSSTGQPVVLTETLWRTLVDVNIRLNQEIRPATDKELYGREEYWTYPTGSGDCEDYVLAKRRSLVEAGWPLTSLMVAVVRKADGEGHAVLIVATDRGDLVLDNLDGYIRRWTETPYLYLKRQVGGDLRTWYGIFDDRHLVVASTGRAAH